MEVRRLVDTFGEKIGQGDFEIGDELLEGWAYTKSSYNRLFFFQPSNSNFYVVVFTKVYELDNINFPWHVTREIGLHQTTGVQVYYGYYKE